MSKDNNHEDDDRRTESIGGGSGSSDTPRIDQLGHFKIQSTLGSGGMGTIYHAYDESMRRDVALKVLHPSLGISWTGQTRFVREAWIAGQLDHPNIVKAYERGEEKGISYFAMELVEGGSLADLIKQTRSSIPENSSVSDTLSREYINTIAERFIEIAEALEYVHSKGFIHRDIKPANILVSKKDNRFKLTDFGIAHADDMTRMTKAGDFIGTVQYMSPELIAAHRAGIDHRSDIYSLGVTLYEALTMALPFEGDSQEKLISEILSGRQAPARKRNNLIPRDLETVLLKAMNHDVNTRYQTAMEFADDLRAVLNNEPVQARRPTVLTCALKFLSRHRLLFSVLGIAIVIMSGTLAYLSSVMRKRQYAESVYSSLTATLETATKTKTSPYEFEPRWDEYAEVLVAELCSGEADSATEMYYRSQDQVGYVYERYATFDEAMVQIRHRPIVCFREDTFDTTNASQDGFIEKHASALLTFESMSDDSVITNIGSFAYVYGTSCLEPLWLTVSDHVDTTTEGLHDIIIRHVVKRYPYSGQHHVLIYCDTSVWTEQPLKLMEEKILDTVGSDIRFFWSDSIPNSYKRPHFREVCVVDENTLTELQPIATDTIIDTIKMQLFSGYPEEGVVQEIVTLSDSLARASAFDSALVLAQTALGITEQFGYDDTTVARIQYKIGRLYYLTGNVTLAESLFVSALKTYQVALPEDDAKIGSALNAVGLILAQQGRSDEAIPYYLKSLDIKEKTLGFGDPRVANSLNNLGGVYLASGQYSKAEPVFERALKIRVESLGSNHVDVGKTLSRLGNLYLRIGRMGSADSCLNRGYSLLDSLLPGNNDLVAEASFNLAKFMNASGEYQSAESLLTRATEIWRENGSSKLHKGLVELAVNQRKQGNFEKAELILKQAVELLSTRLGGRNIDVVRAANSLANLYTAMSMYDEAEQLYRRTLDSARGSSDPKNQAVALTLNNLAYLYIQKAEMDPVEPLLREAIEIYEGRVGREHLLTADAYKSMAEFLTTQGRFSEAVDLLNRARTIVEHAFGESSFKVGVARVNMAEIYLQAGDYSLGEGLLLDAMSLFTQLAEVDHRMVAFCLEKLSLLNRTRSSENLALDQAMQAWDLRLDEFKNSSLNLSENQALARGKLLTQSSANLASCMIALSESGGHVSDEVIDRVLSAKGIATEDEANLQGYVSSAEILAAMPPQSLLINYIKFEHQADLKSQRNPYYMALVLSEQSSPVLYDLGEAALIDDLITRYRDHFLTLSASGRLPGPNDKLDYQNIAGALHSRIWAPLEKSLSDHESIIVSPDGGLNFIAFSTLMDNEQRYLAEKYLIHYLSSVRDLSYQSDTTASGIGLLAIGDPDFNASVEARSERSLQSDASMTTADDAGVRNSRAGSISWDDLTVSLLPETRLEVERIAEVWRRSTEEPLAIGLGLDANEAWFKHRASGMRIIHLATHGYFLRDDCPDIRSTSAWVSEDDGLTENRSFEFGFLLAGANLHGEGAQEAGLDDGIVTAEEIGMMDLKSTQLVVLSACGVGKGKAVAEQGMFGLMQAFQIAGAKSVLSYLWPTSDSAAAALMGQLYCRRNESLPSSIRRMQLRTIDSLRKNGESDHPLTWGSFIAMGDWR